MSLLSIGRSTFGSCAAGSEFCHYGYNINALTHIAHCTVKAGSKYIHIIVACSIIDAQRNRTDNKNWKSNKFPICYIVVGSTASVTKERC